jgi:hypothetical protein
MNHKLGLTLTTALVLAVAGTFASVSETAARTAREILQAPTYIFAQANPQNRGNAGQRSAAPRSAAPRSAAPRSGPSNVGQRSMGQRSVGQSNIGQRSIGQRSMSQRTMGQRTIGQRNIGQRNIGQRNISQRNMDQRTMGQRNIGQRNVGQRNIGQRRIGHGTVGQGSVGQAGRGLRSASIRGVSRVSLGGRNYSIWRGSHRVRHGGGWRTFVTLSTLGGLAVGGATYYPYAYIDAPAPLCEGLTEDGCQLQWQQVQTVEGDPDFQCVAYCPWR